MRLIKDAGARSSDAENNNNSYQKSSSDCDLLLDDRRKWGSHLCPQTLALNPEISAQSVFLLAMQLESTAEVSSLNPALKSCNEEVNDSMRMKLMPWASSLSSSMEWCPLMSPDTHGHFLLIASRAQPPTNQQRVGPRTEIVFQRNHDATCILIQTLRADAAGPASPSGAFPGPILFQTHFEEKKGNDSHGSTCSYNIYNFSRAFCPRSRWCPEACLA